VGFGGSAPFPVSYCVEPQRNIALARNRAIELATGDDIAFIDDDEFPGPGWLATLARARGVHRSDAVLGPVLPHFDHEPPAWVRKGGFYDRPRYETGQALHWRNCRNGHVLFDRSVLNLLEVPFRAEFGTGGEDQDFFFRLSLQNRVFTWCDEAAVYETVPLNRCTRGFMVRRALLRGANSLKHRSGRDQVIAKSVLAVPLYLATLPFLQVGGHHLFMKYLVRLCDHVGRLLALSGIRFVSKREM
jgi:succinoglycan biosynthesis protein ExoM